MFEIDDILSLTDVSLLLPQIPKCSDKNVSYLSMFPIIGRFYTRKRPPLASVHVAGRAHPLNLPKVPITWMESLALQTENLLVSIHVAGSANRHAVSPWFIMDFVLLIWMIETCFPVCCSIFVERTLAKYLLMQSINSAMTAWHVDAIHSTVPLRRNPLVIGGLLLQRAVIRNSSSMR